MPSSRSAVLVVPPMLAKPKRDLHRAPADLRQAGEYVEDDDWRNNMEKEMLRILNWELYMSKSDIDRLDKHYDLIIKSYRKGLVILV